MRGRVAIALGGALILALGGCRNCDLVEAELRTRENELRDIRSEMVRKDAFNEALQREILALRSPVAAKLSPEQAALAYTLQEVTLGRLTGGYTDEKCPGDQGLQVLLEPRDPDNHIIKAPGSLHVEALEISSEGLKLPLSAWDVSADSLRRTWKSGFFITGYYVLLPWKDVPQFSKLRVVARFTLPDQRAFEADKDVTIRVASDTQRDSGPFLVPSLPAGSEVPLPPPRKLQDQPGKGPSVPGSPSDAVQPASLWRKFPGAHSPRAAEILPPIPAP
jgi:hypothetical protein